MDLNLCQPKRGTKMEVLEVSHSPKENVPTKKKKIDKINERRLFNYSEDHQQDDEENFLLCFSSFASFVESTFS